MAYYNPLQQQQGYYDAYNNTPTESASSVIGGAIKSLVTISALNLVGTAATKWLGGKAHSTMKKWLKQPGGPKRAIAQKAYKAQRIVSRNKAVVKKHLANTSYGKAAATRQAKLAGMKGKPGYGSARLTSAFKNPKTLLATTAGVWKRNVLSGMGVAYAVDTMLGVTSKELGLEKKAWYDVPGKASNFGKWLVNDSIYGTAMGGAGAVVGAIGSATGKALGKAFGGEFGKKIIGAYSKHAPGLPVDKRYDKFYNDQVKEVIAGVRSKQEQKMTSRAVKTGQLFGKVSDVYRQIQQAAYSLPDTMKEGFNSPGSLGTRTKKAFGVMEGAIRNAKEVFERPRAEIKSTLSTPGLQAVSAMNQLGLDSLAGGGTKGAGTARIDTAGMNSYFIPELERQANRKGFIDKVFGFLEPLKVRDVVDRKWQEETLGNISHKYAEGDAKLLMDSVMNMRVGQHHYRGFGHKIKGAGIDLSAFDPVLQMKRTASFIANKRFTIPMTKLDFSLGDIIPGSEHLQEAPTFEFFKGGKPNFQFGDRSIGDLANSDNPLYMYINGKYAVFEGADVIAVDSERRLRYTARSSRDKALELKRININRWKNMADYFGNSPEEAAEYYNKIKDRVDNQDAPRNRFLNFLHRKTGLALPSKLEGILDTINAKIQGKNHYETAAGGLFSTGIDDAIDGAGRNLPYISNVHGHTSQVFSRILHNKDALLHIAQFTHNQKLEKNILGIAFNDQTLMDQLDNLDWTADKWSRDVNMVRAVHDIKAFPKQAKHHSITKRLGPLSEMTSYDTARVNLIDDVFNTWFMEIGSGNGKQHPLIAAVPGLLKKNLITQKEAKSLTLHAKLSVFKDKGMFKHTGLPAYDPVWQKALKSSRNIAKENNWQIEHEIIDVSSNLDMRRPSIRKSQQHVLGETFGIGQSVEDFVSDRHPYTSVATGTQALKEFADGVLESSTDMMSEWLPFRKKYIANQGLVGNLKYIGGMVGLTAATLGSYRVLDTVVAANPVFDDTMLDEGITGLGADTVAKARLAGARVADMTGITATMKYMHGLAPKSETALPGAVIGGIAATIMKKNPLAMGAWMLKGALVNRLASPYMPDMTKSHEELVDIYSGREMVPFMKSPTWLLGGTPWEGTKVEGYTPNWYVRAKSRYKETDTMYGSAFRRLVHEPLPLLGFNVGDIVDPYYMERKHFFDRPYPVTGGVFDEVPIIGKILSATVGRIIKPEKSMHQEFLQSDHIKAKGPGDPYGFAIRPPTLGEGKGMMQHPSRVRSLGGITTNGGNVQYRRDKMWSETAAEDFLYDVQQLTGIKGFLAGSVSQRIFGEEKVIPTLQSAGRMASMSRSFYDMNLGGMGVLTEPVRRLVDKPEYKRYGINPIPNMMPNWLPSHFTTGDPYEKIIKGELRLPGEAYLKTHSNVDRRAMPGRASMLGGRKEDIISYFTGLMTPLLKEEYDILESGTSMHEQIQDYLAAEGLLVQAEALVFDAKNDISGHVDAIIRSGKGGGGKKALEIKTINAHGFEKLDAPKDQHVGQLNFYLKQLKMKQGQILYVNRENPSQVKTYELNYSNSRWERDLKKLKEARQTAATMMQEGIGDTLGYSYSWLDRLDILSDVAPTSTEFKEAKYLVNQQIKFGQMTDKEITRYNKILAKRQNRIRKYELYPDRFKGKLFNPDTEKNIQSINEDIKAGADYTLPERAVGWMWEKFTNTNHFLVNKLFAVKDPLEHYKMTRLYGKEYKPWDEPIRSWVDPYSRGLASKTNPFSGALSYGTGGAVLGGPLGAILGGTFGAGYGAVHGLYRKVTGTTYIPETIQEKREIVSYFDAAKYAKADMLSQLSAGLASEEYQSVKASTLTAFNQGGGNVADLFRGTAFTEKPYIEAFLNTKSHKERQKILKYIPEDLGKALQRQWSQADTDVASSNFNNQNSEDIAAGSPRVAFNRQILDPRIPLEDIELRTIQDQGFDAHEFGLGWNEQMLRVQTSMNQAKAINDREYSREERPDTPNISSAMVRGSINELFRKHGVYSSSQVYINNSGVDVNMVNITIKRDRSNTIIKSLQNRSKYMR